MLFLAIVLSVFGYDLLYAGVKGDHYAIGGTAVWRQPWLPFVAAFTGAGLDISSVAKPPSGSDGAVNPFHLPVTPPQVPFGLPFGGLLNTPWDKVWQSTGNLFKGLAGQVIG